MMIVLKKTYTIEVIIQEGNDEFWESLGKKTGADEVVAEIISAMIDKGFVGPGCEGGSVRLVKFEERAPLS